MDAMIEWVGWSTLGVALLVFGFAPRLVLHLITMAWPASDPRRAELRNALDHLDYAKRPLYVADCLSAIFTDALRARRWARLTTPRKPTVLVRGFGWLGFEFDDPAAARIYLLSLSAVLFILNLIAWILFALAWPLGVLAVIVQVGASDHVWNAGALLGDGIVRLLKPRKHVRR